jgi:murein DD-endopeptidase MepM/ murein hydrolase activator NlpD
MIIPDGVENPFGFKIRAWMFKTIIVLFVLITVAIILFFSFYGKIITRAALADKLERENEMLKRYKYKLTLLEDKMKETRDIVNRIASLAGVDFNLPGIPDDSIIFAEFEKQTSATIVRPITASNTRPLGLPLKGFMTRGFKDAADDFHPGIDIAVATETPVLATAIGKVVFAGYDSTYGLTVIIEHENNIATLYGHNSKLLVEEGREVLVGGRIALSGSTGKSSAPHLHYEIRENGKPVNPLKYINENEEFNKQE